MSIDVSPLDALRKLKAAQERYVLFIGLGIGVLLVIYFFTFAQLIDRGYGGLVWFQVISALVMTAALFVLKRLAFFLVRLFHGRRSPYREILARIGPFDLDQDVEKLAEERFASGR
ncbi:MAG: hypothetical protein RBT81_05455 [Gammaproteobacteria bacterium]|jgi:hypothetical protein|nr:hypothetical protein [Gammaproteobacteria bacterium]